MADDNGTAAGKSRPEGAGHKQTSTAGEAAATLRNGAQKVSEAFGEHVVDPARRASEAMRETGRRAAEGGTTISMKLIDQAESNAQEAFAALRAAARANDLTGVMKVQGDYMREQSSRAMNQAREIGELIVKFGKDAIAPLPADEEKPTS